MGVNWFEGMHHDQVHRNSHIQHYQILLHHHSHQTISHRESGFVDLGNQMQVLLLNRHSFVHFDYLMHLIKKVRGIQEVEHKPSEVG